MRKRTPTPLHVFGKDAQIERQNRGDANTTDHDSYQHGETMSTQGMKLDADAEQKVAVSVGLVTEENWSELRNLRVAGESEASARTWPCSRSSFSADMNRQEIRRTSRYAHMTTLQEDSRFSKSSLNFILDDQAASAAFEEKFTFKRKQPRCSTTGHLSKGARDDFTLGVKGDLATSKQSNRTSRLTSKLPIQDGKRRARRPPSRICKYDGCEQYVVDQGLCVRHGGGKRCQTLGCTSRAKYQGRCWKHGGSVKCKVAGCINRAKSRGFCWSHGGGTKCKAESCEKIAISNSLCWAHGGGKRCEVERCMRQAYERTGNLCNNHYQERQRGGSGGADDEEKPLALSTL
ncbi:unnamed protein product [Peronospora belbahrii]|uniref:WRKY19-like zinc finger domain-containing protein n=1 Tax=Peronospora belbahrii TaxID=622444 RepID=A0AAU9L6T2_9STRA|nr:unnamed protein product [Peronospora belbahrii]